MEKYRVRTHKVDSYTKEVKDDNGKKKKVRVKAYIQTGYSRVAKKKPKKKGNRF